MSSIKKIEKYYNKLKDNNFSPFFKSEIEHILDESDSGFIGFMLTVGTDVVYISKSMFKMFGFEDGEAISENVEELILKYIADEESRQSQFDMADDIYSGRKDKCYTHYNMKLKDGKIKNVLSVAKKIQYKGKIGIISINIDVSEFKEGL